jgi:hypothetical protein
MLECDARPTTEKYRVCDNWFALAWGWQPNTWLSGDSRCASGYPDDCLDPAGLCWPMGGR